MAYVNVLNVQVLDNPAAFTSPFQFQITFECVKQLVDGECTAGAVKLLAYYAFGNHTDIEWKVIYVGSASSDQYDQELDSVLVGPVPLGVSKFVLQVDGPDSTQIPRDDLLGVTVILLTCLYRGQEFIRVGYYVNNEIEGGLKLNESEVAEGEDLAVEEDEEEEDEEEEDEEELRSENAAQIAFDKDTIESQTIDVNQIRRVVLAESPRVTRFAIHWGVR